MKKLIGGAFAASILSTLCCAPAFLFVIFGVSIGSFGVLSSLEFVRIPMALVAILCFIYALYSKIKLQKSCDCTKITSLKTYAMFTALFLIIASFLFYPEILPIFIEN